MTTALYGLPNCDTCRKARKWLDQTGIEYRFIDYRAKPVSAATLHAWAREIGGWEKTGKKSSARSRHLDETPKSARSGAPWTPLISAPPAPVKRPVPVLGDGHVSVGFSAQRFEHRFAGK